MTRTAMRRTATLIAAVTAGLLLLALAGIAALLAWPRPAAEMLVSRLLDRRVAIAELSIGWQDPVLLRLRGLQIANIPDGSSADMVAIEALEAAIDRTALLQGRLVYERLHVERPRVALERDSHGRGNWQFGAAEPGDDAAETPSDSRLVLIPKTRQQFPSLLDFRLTGGEVRFRTSSGKWLRLPLDDLAIQAADETAPVSIVLDGGYNETDAQLTASTASFNAFRDATKPFDAGFSIVAAGVKLDFKGVIGEPLDFDAVEGRLALEARRLDDVIRIFDSPSGIAAPVKLIGGLSRAGDAWRLDDIHGDIGGNRFEGRIALDEGGRGEADDLQIRLDFDRLDLPGILPQGSDDWRRLRLRPATAEDTAHLDIQLSAGTLLYGEHRLQQAAAAVEVAAGHIRLQGATARLGETGQLKLAGALRAQGETGGTLLASLQLQKAEAGAVLQIVGLRDGAALLAGAVDGAADIGMTGATLGEAVKTARGHAVLTMQQGRIARSLVEAASADLRALFRSRDDGTALRCLLAAATLKDGTLVLAPVILRSDGGTVRAAGQIDLVQQQVEVTLRSDPQTTGFLALDIPLRIHGPLADPSAQPLRGAALPDLPPPVLPPAQAALAQGNPCRN
ncbi:MAG: AsmA family protein [Ferrovibrio sp.]|uniref:AsmA family protein n=1 Tax=Ferrovibrio sp. TaxID=1917215 RepID=UPI00262ADE8B|nr:AsmA-like C-terminal region-containing protein [Ferrovibrio sp.]MCW0234404.1 AsmA family protein [Ferrovibrio sp.]